MTASEGSAGVALQGRATHQHDVDELTWVVTGRSTIVVDGEDWWLDQTTAAIIPAGTVHTILPRSDSLVFPLFCPDGFWGADGIGGADGERRVELIDRSPALESCAAVILQPGLSSPNAVDAARRELGVLVRSASRTSRPVLPTDERAKQVADAILAHPATALGIEDWARVTHTSSKTLQRLFRRETGLTFPQWRAAARLSAAAQRLAAGESVAAVARAVGYASTSAFSDAFRRRYRVAPTRYARRRPLP